MSEADVIASLEAGDLKGKQIGSQWRITRAALAEFLSNRREPHVRPTAGSEPRPSRTRVVAAREKFHCPACGAEAHWNPGQAGADLPVLRHGIAGHARDAQRRRRSSSSTISPPRCAAFPTTRAAGRPRRPPSAARAARRSRCSIPAKVGQRCDFCGSAALVPYEQVKDAFRPEVAAAAQDLRVAGARSDSRAGTAASGSRRTRFNAKALTDTVKGIYLPYWTFDANADARWTADSGTYYYVRRGQEAGAARALDAGVRRARRTSSTMSWCRASLGVEPTAAARGRAVSDRHARAVRRRVSGWLDGRALSDRSRGRGRRDRAQQMEATLRRAVRAAGARRHAPQSGGRCDVHATRRSSTSWRRSGC